MPWEFVSRDGRTHTAALIAVLTSGAEYRHGDPDAVDLTTIDSDTIVGWRVGCTCNWTSAGLLRQPDRKPADVAGLRTVWEEHLWPITMAARLRDDTEAIAQANKNRARDVALARMLGLSWADIGSATGMARQSAQERWATEGIAVMKDDQGRIWPVVSISDVQPGDRIPPDFEKVYPHHKWVRITEFTRGPDGLMSIDTDETGGGMEVFPNEVWDTPVHPHWL
jgi:hypothetical protein